MTENRLVHIAWMARWNSPAPTHGYVEAVTENNELCDELGNAEAQYRGGKYTCQRMPTYIDYEWNPRTFLSVTKEKNIPTKVYIAIAVWKEDVLPEESWHCVGAFSTKEKAKQFCEKKYRGWTHKIEKHKVIFNYEPNSMTKRSIELIEL